VITDRGYTQAGHSRQARVLLRPLAALMPCISWPELTVSRGAAEPPRVDLGDSPPSAGGARSASRASLGPVIS
jgi:hypothetical protein